MTATNMCSIFFSQVVSGVVPNKLVSKVCTEERGESYDSSNMCSNFGG